MNTDRIHDEFPAPSYRGHQEEALDRIAAAFDDGNDVVLVRAPTGSGKSLLARAICGCARTHEEADHASEAVGAYYTTPQVSQLDDAAEDELLEDFAVIRGKSNYTCILPDERDTPVDRAPCAREAGYDCSVKDRCPYFSDRAIAANRGIAAMTLAYFMQTAGSEVFRKRDVCVIDEAHGLAEWAEMYATIELSPHTVPVWDDLSVPEVDGLDDAVAFAEATIRACEGRKDALIGQPELSASEAAERDQLQERISELRYFVDDYRSPEGTTTWLVDQRESGETTIKPLEPERYLQHTVWDRANRFALLSATILDRDAFCAQLGLDPDRTALVELPHTFPLEHRPLYDVTCGRMTREHRDRTLPRLADTVAAVMQEHDDEKGIVHCHAYDIQRELADRLAERGLDGRLWVHDRADRDGTLAAWKSSGGAGVLLAVAMEEALDLEGDLARWQVLCKAPFPNAGDARVKHRLENDRWAWYYRATLRTVIQACGRVVRSPDDVGATYVADDSLLDVFERARSDMPDWFREQVDAMTEPDLPEPPGGWRADAAGAVDGDADAAGASGTSASGGSSRAGGRSGGRGGAAASGAASDDSAASDDGAAAGSEAASDGEEAEPSAAGSPLADVWDDG